MIVFDEKQWEKFLDEIVVACFGFSKSEKKNMSSGKERGRDFLWTWKKKNTIVVSSWESKASLSVAWFSFLLFAVTRKKNNKLSWRNKWTDCWLAKTSWLGSGPCYRQSSMLALLPLGGLSYQQLSLRGSPALLDPSENGRVKYAQTGEQKAV